MNATAVSPGDTKQSNPRRRQYNQAGSNPLERRLDGPREANARFTQPATGRTMSDLGATSSLIEREGPATCRTLGARTLSDLGGSRPQIRTRFSNQPGSRHHFSASLNLSAMDQTGGSQVALARHRKKELSATLSIDELVSKQSVDRNLELKSQSLSPLRRAQHRATYPAAFARSRSLDVPNSPGETFAQPSPKTNPRHSVSRRMSELSDLEQEGEAECSPVVRVSSFSRRKSLTQVLRSSSLDCSPLPSPVIEEIKEEGDEPAAVEQLFSDKVQLTHTQRKIVQWTMKTPNAFQVLNRDTVCLRFCT